MPKLSKDNRKFWEFFQKVLPGLLGGMGGFDYRAIESAFAIYGISKFQRPVIMDQCIVIIDVIKEIREKERNK